jgi:hypothetical protein
MVEFPDESQVKICMAATLTIGPLPNRCQAILRRRRSLVFQGGTGFVLRVRFPAPQFYFELAGTTERASGKV